MPIAREYHRTRYCVNGFISHNEQLVAAAK